MSKREIFFQRGRFPIFSSALKREISLQKIGGRFSFWREKKASSREEEDLAPKREISLQKRESWQVCNRASPKLYAWFFLSLFWADYSKVIFIVEYIYQGDIWRVPGFLTPCTGDQVLWSRVLGTRFYDPMYRGPGFYHLLGGEGIGDSTVVNHYGVGMNFDISKFPQKWLVW